MTLYIANLTTDEETDYSFCKATKRIIPSPPITKVQGD